MELYTESVHKLFTCLYFFVVEFFTLFCFNMSLEIKSKVEKCRKKDYRQKKCRQKQHQELTCGF